MPLITQKDLEKQIKTRSFSPIYVIYGSEQMYVRRFTQKLTEAVAGKNPSEFNFHTFSGEVDLDTLAAAAEMVPFMSEYNCVLVTDIFLDAMSADETDKFKAICKRVIDGTVLILSMPTYIPKRNAKVWDAVQKRAQKDGSVIKFERPDERTLEKYVAKWANSRGKLISLANVRLLMRYCGADMNRLQNEVAKICAYSQGGEVTTEAIEKLVAKNLEAKIFKLSDAVLSGRGDEAFSTLDLLFAQKEEPVMMLYVLSTAYTDAYRIRVADESGVPLEQAAEDFDYKKRTFALKNARKATSSVSTEALRKSLCAITEADMKMKSVSVNPRLHLEQLIAQLLLIAREGRG